MIKKTALLLSLLLTPLSWAHSATEFVAIKPDQKLETTLPTLKAGQIAFKTYITDGTVTKDASSNRYTLKDNDLLPVDKRKDEKTKKAVRVVHAEYILSVEKAQGVAAAFTNLRNSSTTDTLINAILPENIHTHINNDESSTELFFPCDIVKLFKSVERLPSSEIATATDSGGKIQAKVDLYLKDFFPHHDSLSYKQYIQFQDGFFGENKSVEGALKKLGLNLLGSMTQNFFDFNQIVRTGDLRVNFFADPKNLNRAVIYIESRLAIRADIMAIGPDKNNSSSGKFPVAIPMGSPLEDYLMNGATVVGVKIAMADLIGGADLAIGISDFSPTPQCQSARGPSLIKGIPEFQQSYVSGIANLFSKF